MHDYTRFMILSSPRSGTHMLRTSLNGHPNIEAKTEIFNPDYIENEPFDENTPEEVILEQHLFCKYPDHIKAVGFILHRRDARFGKWPRLWQILKDDINLKIVSLQRHNLLRRYLSVLTMVSNINKVPLKPWSFKIDELKEIFIHYEQEIALFEQQFSRHEIFRVTYEELCSDYRGVMHRLQVFNDVPPRTLRPNTNKNLVKPLSQVIVNFHELREGFAGSRWAWFFDSEEPKSPKLGIRERCSSPASHYGLELALFHNTRHASPKHAFTHKSGQQLRSPWLSRFHWILDADLEAEYSAHSEVILTKQRPDPLCVFVKLDLLPVFISDVLPQIKDSVLLYIGNANSPLSGAEVDVNALANHPMIHRIFCENKNIPIDSIQAMPIGIHPKELATDNYGYELHVRSQKIDLDKKINKVMGCWKLKKSIHETREDRFELKAWMRAEPDLFNWYDIKPQREYWDYLAAHRFMLAQWCGSYDTGRIFEALALKTIPIVFKGTYAEAYAGLPVLVIQQISDITKSNLDNWWEALKPLFDDMEFLQGKYWWRKVKRALPVRKRVFWVVGPESPGLQQVSDILAQAGCHEHSADHRGWQTPADTNGNPAGCSAGHEQNHIAPTWDASLPQDQAPIFWRLSVPHLDSLPDIAGMVASLEDQGYTPVLVVVTKDKQWAVQSQVNWEQVGDIINSSAGLEHVFQHIFKHIELADIPYTVVSHESLVRNPPEQDSLLQDLGIVQPQQRVEVFGSNKRGLEKLLPIQIGWRQDTTSAPVSDMVAGFPEYWFTCKDPQTHYGYKKAVEKGGEVMLGLRTVICGLARDVITSLPVLSARIEQLGMMFADYRVVLFENDSGDGTAEYIEQWQQGNPKVHLLSEVLASLKWGRVRNAEKTQDMASYRNRYLDYVQNHFADFDCAIVLDTDIERGFSYDGIAHSFFFYHSDARWHVVGSNSLWVPEFDVPPAKPTFFDVFAFRHIGDEAMRPAKDIYQMHFRRGEQMLPVWSCFGGLAVYDMQAFLCGARYGGDDCEHVVFHRQLREKGFARQFMNPNQIVLYSGG